MRPVTREVWRERASGRRVVIRGARDQVDYIWLDDQRPERAPWRRFARQFELVLANPDFLDCLAVRQKALIDDFADHYRGRSVLELGAHIGGLTQAIVRHAAQVTVIENNVKCVAVLRQLLPGARVLSGDAHHLLWKLKPGDFDVIVCAGLLYHSAHPFFLLEGMAYLQPSHILIDTLDARVPKEGVMVGRTAVNTINFRYNRRRDCGMNCVLGRDVITTAMSSLGFDLEQVLDKRSCTIDPAKDSEYFQNWKAGFSAWYEA